MVKLRDVLNKVDDMREDFNPKEYSIILKDNLPDNFKGLNWGDLEEFEYDGDEYGYSMAFVLNVGHIDSSGFIDDEAFYTEVRISPRDTSSYDISIHFGEDEQGDIDIDSFVVSDESSYSYFIKELLGYVIHTFDVLK